ncbi:hypothetical protein [Endozoicomonas atrinae]|uniref:hypothetical protein n=1 Tax=Endozoicomonas atrinae TaxID=1333660 RepID=UPI0008266439|nr:hypothetical protein [Endozoicomonas atrinae]
MDTTSTILIQKMIERGRYQINDQLGIIESKQYGFPVIWNGHDVKSIDTSELGDNLDRCQRTLTAYKTSLHSMNTTATMRLVEKTPKQSQRERATPDLSYSSRIASASQKETKVPAGRFYAVIVPYQTSTPMAQAQVLQRHIQSVIINAPRDQKIYIMYSAHHKAVKDVHNDYPLNTIRGGKQADVLKELGSSLGATATSLGQRVFATPIPLQGASMLHAKKAIKHINGLVKNGHLVIAIRNEDCQTGQFAYGIKKNGKFDPDCDPEVVRYLQNQMGKMEQRPSHSSPRVYTTTETSSKRKPGYMNPVQEKIQKLTPSRARSTISSAATPKHNLGREVDDLQRQMHNLPLPSSDSGTGMASTAIPKRNHGKGVDHLQQQMQDLTPPPPPTLLTRLRALCCFSKT